MHRLTKESYHMSRVDQSLWSDYIWDLLSSNKSHLFSILSLPKEWWKLYFFSNSTLFLLCSSISPRPFSCRATLIHTYSSWHTHILACWPSCQHCILTWPCSLRQSILQLDDAPSSWAVYLALMPPHLIVPRSISLLKHVLSLVLSRK